MLDKQQRDVTSLAVPRVGRVAPTGNPQLAWRVEDAAGAEVTAVAEFLRDMAACDAAGTTLRSYCYELLGWLRFLSAVDVAWDRATRAEARDFALWLAQAGKLQRRRREGTVVLGTVNAVTGKPYHGNKFAVNTRRHARAVIHAFYEFHRQEYGRPLLNPFPATRRRADEHINAHHNPMQAWRSPLRAAPYQPKAPQRIPRAIPDHLFNQLFAALECNRDRALLAFWISTGARATELLTASCGRAEPADRRGA